MAMKLSEAIRLGAMLKPQGFGSSFIRSEKASCALGAALDACGIPMSERRGEGAYDAVRRLWPWLGNPEKVWSRNDISRWTREQIADWVETLEQQAVAKDGAASMPAPEPVGERAEIKSI